MAAIKIKTGIFVAATCVIALLNGSAMAEDHIHTTVHYYDIEPGLTITKPVFSISRDFTLDTNISMRFTVDRVNTGAFGADATSGASQYAGASGISDTDTREEIAVAISHTTGNWKIEPGYAVSHEEDYRSQAPSIKISRDFFQRNTTLSFGYARNFDEVMGRYMSESRDKDVDNYAVSLTQILTPWTIAQAGYTLSAGTGYMGTGNRKVRLINGSEFDEFLPEERKREAAGIRVAQWLPTDGSVQLSYRYYTDDWKIDSNTYQIQINQSITDAFLIRGEYRYYEQGKAYFVQDSYTGAERYLTSASSLRAFNSNLYGVKLIYAIKGRRDWDLEAKYERYTQANNIESNITMLGIRMLL